jgi:Flp pilus assembly pilin Flp
MRSNAQPLNTSGIDGAKDRGVAMVSYALLVTLISIVSVVAVSAVGRNTSDEFTQISTALGSGDLAETTTTTTTPMTPKEKWDKAQADWKAARDLADDNYNAAVDQAAAIRDAQKDANKSLPNAEKKVANQQANDDFNAAKDAAKGIQLSARQVADDAKDVAQAEYKATK